MLAGATLPWWLGGVVRHYAAPFGVTFSSYESEGYGRWAVEDVAWRDAGIVVEAARVEGPHPLIWWWKKSEAPSVLIEGLKVDLRAIESREGATEGKVRGPESAVNFYHQLKPLIPLLELSKGTLVFSDTKEIGFEKVALRGFDLTLSKVSFEDHAATIRLQLNAESTRDGFEGELFKFKASGVDDNWSLAGVMSARRSQLDLQGQWHNQAFSASGLFRSDRWIPDSGRLVAENWSVAASEFKLGEFYQNIGGDVLVSWMDGRFNQVQLRFDGQPIEAGKYPPLSIQLWGRGNLESAEIQQLKISTPGLSLTATQPFEISRDSVQAGAVSDLMLRADLAEIPFVTGTGSIAGGLRVTAREQDWPLIDFTLTASKVGVSSAPAVDGELTGQVAWPRWEVSSLRLQDTERSEVRLNVLGDGVTRSIESGSWEATVLAKSLAPWVKLGDVSWSEIEAKGTVSGTVNQMAHQGSWTIREVLVPKLKPVAVAGRWTGQNAEATVSAQLSAGMGKVDLEGALTAESFAAERLEIRHEEDVVLALTEPTTVR